MEKKVWYICSRMTCRKTVTMSDVGRKWCHYDDNPIPMATPEVTEAALSRVGNSINSVTGNTISSPQVKPGENRGMSQPSECCIYHLYPYINVRPWISMEMPGWQLFCTTESESCNIFILHSMINDYLEMQRLQGIWLQGGAWGMMYHYRFHRPRAEAIRPEVLLALL